MQLLDFVKKRCFFLVLLVYFFSIFILNSQIHASTKNLNYVLEISNNQRMILVAKGVQLGTLLEKIREKTNLEFQIPEDLYKQPIFVTFQSLPLKDGLRRILHGLSYACIFDSNGNVEKIITFTNYSKAKESSFPSSTQDGSLPLKVDEEIMSPPEEKDIEEAMGIESSGKSEKDMNPSEIEDMEIAMDIKPPPVIEDIEAAMGIESSGKKESP